MICLLSPLFFLTVIEICLDSILYPAVELFFYLQMKPLKSRKISRISLDSYTSKVVLKVFEHSIVTRRVFML